MHTHCIIILPKKKKIGDKYNLHMYGVRMYEQNIQIVGRMNAILIQQLTFRSKHNTQMSYK